MSRIGRAACLILLTVAAGCDRGSLGADRSSPPRVVAKDAIRFAALGDYGRAGSGERGVARLIARWRPDLVVTTGDNNYPDGGADTIDVNIGRYYHRFIAPYRGRFGAGALRNRFFPSLGNHDMDHDLGPYLDYFTLPGNERYYEFVAGPVHFFALNSDRREPDGIASDSTQARWLAERLASSPARWRVVYFHHAPYSSGRRHRPSEWMRWPLREWGADLVLTGHEHFYERLDVDGLPYLIVGLGGALIYRFADAVAPESRVRFNDDHGALLVTATPDVMSLAFTTSRGVVVDELELPQ